MSANNVLLQKAVPALLEQAKSLQAPHCMFLEIEHIKQTDEPPSQQLSIHLFNANYTATPILIDHFESTKLLTLGDDREEVSLPFHVLQNIFGPDAKMQAFAVNQSQVIVLMVDKPYNEVTCHNDLMKSIAAVLAEMCDMETGRITEIERIRLPLVISGGFTMTSRHEEETLRIDLYNEDMIHVGAIEGLRLVF